MGITPPYIYERPTQYSLVSSSEKTSDPIPISHSHSSWVAESPRPREESPFISAEDLNRQPESYMIVPYSNLEHKPLAKNTRNVVKWTRVVLLLLRICAWVGAAGLLVCVVCIKPMGTTMDWVIRVPPALALVDLTYAIYHLSGSVNARTPTSAGSYMIFAAIIDSCLVPFQVLLAILAHGQLLGNVDLEAQLWQTVFTGPSQLHTIILSTYLLSITTAGLHLAGLFFCLFLAMKFRKISQLPPDMNPLENNLTARGHKKSKSSVSTFATLTSNPESTTPLVNAPARSVPYNHTRTDSRSTISEPQRRDDVKGSLWAFGPGSANRQSPSRGTPTLLRSPEPGNSTLTEDRENWGSHGPTPPGSPPSGPPEFGHLRNRSVEDEQLKPAPLSTSRYDFSNRSPRPLGLHPPTPRQNTPSSGNGFDVRALRNIDGNSSAKRASKSVWEDIKLELDSMTPSSPGRGERKQYGDIVNVGSVTRSQARVVSSGVDHSNVNGGMKRREVSGKIAEEGRAGGFGYEDNY